MKELFTSWWQRIKEESGGKQRREKEIHFIFQGIHEAKQKVGREKGWGEGENTVYPPGYNPSDLLSLIRPNFRYFL